MSLAVFFQKKNLALLIFRFFCPSIIELDLFYYSISKFDVQTLKFTLIAS